MSTNKDRLRALLLLHRTSPIDELVEKVHALYTTEEDRSLEDRKSAFIETVRPYVDMYGKDMASDFCKYWFEANRKKVMRFELQKTWDVKMRLSTWYKNSNKFSMVGMLSKGVKK